METNRSITSMFHGAHHPDISWWYLSESESHHMGTGAADVAWHWCYIKGWEWQREGRRNYAWALQAASPPPSPPGTHCLPQITFWSWPSWLIIPFNSSWYPACCQLCLPPRLRRTFHGNVFLCWDEVFFNDPLAWICAYFSESYRFPLVKSLPIFKRQRRRLKIFELNTTLNSARNLRSLKAVWVLSILNTGLWVKEDNYLPTGSPIKVSNLCSLNKWNAKKSLSLPMSLVSWLFELKVIPWEFGQGHCGEIHEHFGDGHRVAICPWSQNWSSHRSLCLQIVSFGSHLCALGIWRFIKKI